MIEMMIRFRLTVCPSRQNLVRMYLGTQGRLVLQMGEIPPLPRAETAVKRKR